MASDIDLTMARREAERAMRDRCRITRVGAGGVLDEDTGTYQTVETIVYEGRCRLKSPRTMAKPVDAAGQLVSVTVTELQLPVSAAGVQGEDAVEMTACPDRPAQVGRKFSIAGAFDGTQTTSLRYRVEVADGRV